LKFSVYPRENARRHAVRASVLRVHVRRQVVGGRLRRRERAGAPSINRTINRDDMQMWKNGKIFVNPHKVVRNAHSAAITSFAFSNDNKWLLTRGCQFSYFEIETKMHFAVDDAMKLRSMNDLKTPVRVRKELHNAFNMYVAGKERRTRAQDLVRVVAAR